MISVTSYVISMTIIKPISDLRNNFNEISRLCHKEGQPVYITKNGKGDLVVLSLTAYEQEQARLELYEKLCIAEHQSAVCEKRISHRNMMVELKARLNE
jgi:prevent-host-death family protein